MTILVTGGAGYIGCHAVRALQLDGFRVVVLDNLVYGHQRIVEEVLRVPLVVGQLGDRPLLDQLLSGSISLQPVSRSRRLFTLLLTPMWAKVWKIQQSTIVTI